MVDVPFKPSRVILQDFTGVPAVVDLASLRKAMARYGWRSRQNQSRNSSRSCH